MKPKYYKRHVEITPQQEMHLEVDHYLEPIPEITEEKIRKIMNKEASLHVYHLQSSIARRAAKNAIKAIIKLMEGKS